MKLSMSLRKNDTSPSNRVAPRAQGEVEAERTFGLEVGVADLKREVAEVGAEEI